MKGTIEKDKHDLGCSKGYAYVLKYALNWIAAREDDIRVCAKCQIYNSILD